MLKQIGCHCYSDVIARAMLIGSVCKLRRELCVYLCAHMHAATVRVSVTTDHKTINGIYQFLLPLFYIPSGSTSNVLPEGIQNVKILYLVDHLKYSFLKSQNSQWTCLLKIYCSFPLKLIIEQQQPNFFLGNQDQSTQLMPILC